MSPRAPDPKIRTALVENAARILSAEGFESLSIRRLATEVGVSTMAVYTHFGGKDELLRAVVLEGFARLAAHLEGIGDSDDPMADLCLLGVAYRRNALDNPHLYTAMFGRPMSEVSLTVDDLVVTLATFQTLVQTCRRCIDDGRVVDQDPESMANQFWAAAHGAVTLELTGCYVTETGGEETLLSLAANVLLGMSTDREATERSLLASLGHRHERAGG
jgi:AcrR family transcriptional regulator